MSTDPALHTGNYTSTMKFLTGTKGLPDIQADKLIITARSGGYAIYRRMKIAYRPKAPVNRRYRITQDGPPEQAAEAAS